MKDNYYVANKDETLKDVAAKFGISYARLLRYNPQWVDGVPQGASVVLAEPKDEDSASIANKEDENKNEDKLQSEKEESKENLVSKNESESDLQSQTEKIRKAQEKYQVDKAALDESFSQKEIKLAQSLRASGASSEGDLARRKIDSSSIAQEQRRAIAREYLAQRENLGQDYDAKLQKLEKTLAAVKNKNSK